MAAFLFVQSWQRAFGAISKSISQTVMAFLQPSAITCAKQIENDAAIKMYVDSLQIWESILF